MFGCNSRANSRHRSRRQATRLCGSAGGVRRSCYSLWLVPLPITLLQPIGHRPNPPRAAQMWCANGKARIGTHTEEEQTRNSGGW